MYILYLVFLAVIGAVFGSFVCCQVRRMRCAEKGKKVNDQRSKCLKCGYRLKWYDNIPVVSWLILGGRCRKCKKKIGWLEFLAELAGCVVFLALGMKYGDPTGFIGTDWVMLLLTLGFYLVLLFLALYDAEYGELPQVMLIVAIIWGGVLAAVNVLLNGVEIWSVLCGVAIFGGSYYLLYKLSHERLVGGGDWMLATAIALALGDWWLSLFTICVSNFFAAIVMLPVVLCKKNKNTRIYFGPWMVAGFVFVLCLSEVIGGLLI